MICDNCGKEHNGFYGSGRFCCEKCARSFSTKNDKKGELKEAKCIDCGKIIYIGKRASLKKCRCTECQEKHELYDLNNGIYIELNNKIYKKTDINCNIFPIKCENCYFKKNNICKSKKTINSKFLFISKYCNFKLSTYENTVKDIQKIKDNLQYLIDLGYSTCDICNKIFNSKIKGGLTILKLLNIKTRNLSEAVTNAYLQGKMLYKESWYKTWKGNEIYLRSSYEEDYAKELDENKINYEYESLHIKYFNTQDNKFRCAIPDFYLPETNTIVEIKSNWTLNIQEMKDKVNEYKKLGYNFKLILEHKETDLYSL